MTAPPKIEALIAEPEEPVLPAVTPATPPSATPPAQWTTWGLD